MLKKKLAALVEIDYSFFGCSKEWGNKMRRGVRELRSQVKSPLKLRQDDLCRSIGLNCLVTAYQKRGF